MSAVETTAGRFNDDEAVETLSTLALNAAIQLDRFILDKEGDISAINQLAKGLHATPLLSDAEGPKGLLFDPNKMVALSRAIGMYSGHELSTVAELADTTTVLIAEFEASEITSAKDTQRKLLKFCVALHKALLPLRGPEREEWREGESSSVI